MVSPGTPNPLGRYVPRLLIEWLRDAPDTRHRIITGTCVFADLSGFTAMTERLAAQGTAGAEETGEILNDVFEALLSAAYDFGAGLVKWGGDAVLLLFHGEAHAVRATRAAWVMQNTIARVGRVSTARGPIRLRMSVGINTGDFHFMLVGKQFKDLVVVGPAMTTTARMEQIANAGEVVLSDSTAGILEPGTTELLADGGHLLITPPDAPLLPQHSAPDLDVDLGVLFDPVLREHLTTSRGDYEHRSVSVAFVAAEGSDTVLGAEGTTALYEAIDEVIGVIQDATTEHGVVVLEADLAVNGIKVMVACGAPTSPGDDATRMLSALTAIVGSPTRLTLRAGATHGRVFAGAFGAPFRGTYSLAGDIVNLAARLTYHAEIGSVLATQEIIDRSSGAFVVQPVPPFAAKGKSAPVRALSVARQPSVEDSPTTQLPLIGRSTELGSILSAEADARSRRGRVVELIGDAGIGKSRLIAEYESLATVPIIRIDGDLYAPTRPYASVQHLLRTALGLRSGSSAADATEALRAAVDRSAPHLAPWLPLLAIPAGAAVATTPEVEALDATTRAERLRRVTSELLGALVPEPTALVFNDTHAMDDASVALVRQLCTDAPARPWSLVISRRPEGATGAVFPHASPLALDTLSGEDADALVRAASSIRIPAPRRAQLSERSGGNPLFLRALVETVAAGGDPDDLPSEIEDVLTAHMDRLTPDERGWLRTAAVLGTRVDPDLLAEIIDEPFNFSASPRLSEYIRPEPDGTLVFAHHLIQRTAYEALPFRRRRTLHARASYAIERRAGENLDEVADVLAIHCLRGQRFDAAWQYARTAGRLARERYALVEAAASFDIALEAAGGIPGLPSREVSPVAEDLADAAYTLGDTARTEAALRLARRHARNDTHLMARLALRTVRLRFREGRYSEALRWSARGRALLREDDVRDLPLLAELAEATSLVYLTRGSMRQYRAWAERAVSEATHCGDRQRAATALSQLATAKARAGEPWEMPDMSDEERWDLATRGVIANRLGVASYYSGDPAAAATFYSLAETYSRQAGHQSKAAVDMANRGELLVEAGRFREAAALLEVALDELRTTDATAYIPFALTLLGRATHEISGAAAALPLAEQAHRLAIDAGDVDVADDSAALIELLRSQVSGVTR